MLAPAAHGLLVGQAGASGALATQTSASADTPPTPRPAVGVGALGVRIESVSPAIPRAGDVLRLRGSVANASDGTVTGVRAVLRLSPTPIPSRGEISEILQGAGQRLGVPVTGRGASVQVAAALAPGDASPFTLTVRVDDLGLSAPGAYMVGVEALGDSGGGPVRQDLDRTFLPWWPEDTSALPVQLTMVWPLTGAPLRDAQGVLLSEEPAVEMSPAGRLDVLLRAAAEHPGVASVVVDPQLLQAAHDLSDGYLVLRDGEATTGTRSREVTRWLDGMRALAADPAADVHAMLYGQPDVVAAREGRALGAVLRQRPLADQLSAQALGRSLTSDTVLVPGGLADESTLRTLAAGDVGLVVLSEASMPVVAPSYFTASGNLIWQSGDDRLPVLLTDTRLDATLAMPMTSSSEQVAARQRLLAETLTTALELPESQRLLATEPPAGWSPPTSAAAMVLDTLDVAPWITPTTLDGARDREPSSVARTLAAYPPVSGSQQLSAESVAAARSLAGDLAAYSSAMSEPDTLPAVTRTAPTRILSGWFRTHEGEQRRLTRAVSRQVEGSLRSVRIVSNGAITVSGSSGTIPVTVENQGPAAVTVGLTLTASPAQLFTADPVAPFRIEPGRRTSVEVPAQVNAAGPIPVTIQATTVRGDPFGVPGELTVRSSAYANAARLLVQGSLALLLVTVLVHGVRRARRSGKGGTPRDRAQEAAGGGADRAAADDAARDAEVPHG